MHCEPIKAIFTLPFGAVTNRMLGTTVLCTVLLAFSFLCLWLVHIKQKICIAMQPQYGNYPPPPPPQGMYTQQGPQRPGGGMGGAEGCLAAW